jgi:DNA-binding CsgD family transcriptional regulator
VAEPIIGSLGEPFHVPWLGVFVGRSAELGVVRDAWRAARAGDARVVVLAAGPGTGKTWLLGRFLAESAPERYVWVSGGEPPEEELPWQLLKQLAARLSEWTRHLASWADRNPLSNPAHAGLPLLDELRAAGPVAVIIDDVQWADQKSAAVLRFAARHLSGSVLLAVVCNDEYPVACDEWQRVFPPAPGSMLPLAGLEAQDFVDLATRLGYPGLSPAGAVRLREHTDGNPLFAIEVLGQVPLRAINSGQGPLPAPRRVAGAVAARLAARTEPTRSFAAAAAVIGTEFSVALGAEIAGLADASDQVDELAHAGLIAEVAASDGRRFRFTHALVQRAVYERTPLARRHALHLKAAELTDGSAALWHRVAAAEGPDPILAADLDAQAKDAAARGELEAAAKHWQEALNRSLRGADRNRRLLTLVETLLITGDAASAGAYATEIAANGVDPWSDYVAGYQALLGGNFPEARLRLTRVLDTLDAVDPASIAAADAVDTVPAGNADNTSAAEQAKLQGMPVDLRARAATHLAIMGLVMLDYPAMVRYGEIATTATSADPMVRAFAWFARTLGLTLTGHGQQALTELADDGPGSDLDLLAARGIVELWLDDLDAAIADLTEVVDCAYHGVPLRVAQAMAFLGDAEYRRGLLDASVQHTEHAVWEAEENLRYWDYALLHGFACQTRAARGDWTAADKHARSAEEAAELWAQWTGTGSVKLAAAGSRAVLAQARADPAALLAAAADVDIVLDSPEPGITLLGPLRAEALVQLGDADAAEVALADFTGRFGAAGRKSTLMSIARVRGRIAALRGEHAAALAAYKTALELADSVGLPLEAGRIQLLMGDCLTASKRPIGGAMRLRAALRGFRQIGAHAYAAQAETLIRQHRLPFDKAANPADPLTDLSTAQQEVIKRVAAGLSNQEIGNELVVSAKNVEQHLSTIYRELRLTTPKRAALIRLVNGLG